MTLYQFRSLDYEEQLEVIFSEAIQVAEREDANASYALYQLGSFYIELSVLNNALSTGIKTFANTTLLNPYLKDINVNF